MGHREAAGNIRTRMRRGLTAAMKARDQRVVTALRSALAAIDNAEAVDTAKAQPPTERHPTSGTAPPGEGHPAPAEVPSAGQGRPGAAEVPSAGEGHPAVEGRIAGATVGVGTAEVARRPLTPAETQAIVRGEVAERWTAAHAYERAGQAAHAERLRAEAEVLSAYLDDPHGDLVDPGA